MLHLGMYLGVVGNIMHKDMLVGIKMGIKLVMSIGH